MTERIFHLDELEFPEDLYPRAKSEPWWEHVVRYADEMKAGSTFPPVSVGILGERSIVVDGWHRCVAYRKLGLEYVPAQVTVYSSEKEIFIAAVRANAIHGIQLTPRDKVRIISRLEEWNVPRAEICDIVKATPETMTRLRARTLSRGGTKVHLKSPLAKLRNRGLVDNETAFEFNQEEISVRTVTEAVSQLIQFIEGGVFPWGDPAMGTMMMQLHGLIEEHLLPLGVQR